MAFSVKTTTLSATTEASPITVVVVLRSRTRGSRSAKSSKDFQKPCHSPPTFCLLLAVCSVRIAAATVSYFARNRGGAKTVKTCMHTQNAHQNNSHPCQARPALKTNKPRALNETAKAIVRGGRHKMGTRQMVSVGVLGGSCGMKSGSRSKRYPRLSVSLFRSPLDPKPASNHPIIQSSKHPNIQTIAHQWRSLTEKRRRPPRPPSSPAARRTLHSSPAATAAARARRGTPQHHQRRLHPLLRHL